jgi:hypothetical protein
MADRAGAINYQEPLAMMFAAVPLLLPSTPATAPATERAAAHVAE